MSWQTKGEDLYRDAIVVDATSPILDRDSEWPKWHEGGVTAVMATVATHDDAASAVQKLAKWRARLRRHRDRMIHATELADIRRAKEEGKLAVIFQFQNARPIGYDASLVEVFHRLGVRSIQLTYNIKNLIGDGCTERTDCGLSNLGVAVVREMNRVGILVDLSHTGFRTTMDAMEVSSSPVVFSHSNAKAVYDHPRNLTDEQIRALARTGGVVGLNGFPPVVCAGDAPPTLEDFLAHLDHIADLVGVEHVGLGLDYFSTDQAGYDMRVSTGVWDPKHYPPPPYRFPAEIEDASKLSNLVPALLRRGYSETDARKILGENFVRVFREAWISEAGGN
jgi:membrane dipeptidase